MFRKKAIVVSTAAGNGARKAVKDITDALFYWGIPRIWTYGICVQAMNWDSIRDRKKLKIEKATAKIARKVLRKDHEKPGLRTKGLFMLMRMMQKANMMSGEHDRAYWEKQGWLEKERPWR